MSRTFYDSMFPELERFGTKRSRKLAFRRASDAVHLNAWGIGLLVVVGAVVILARELNPAFMSRWQVDIPVRVLSCGAPMFVALWMLRRAIRTALRRDLNASGKPTCLECGYDLRGQVDPRCPECGEDFAMEQGGSGKA